MTGVQTCALPISLNAVTTRDSKDSSSSKSSENKAAAVQKDQSKSVSADDDIQEVVFVLQKDNTVKKIRVRTAIQDLNNIEVLGGLKEGDMVITGPYSIVSKTLKEGNLVTVVAKEKLFEDKKKN